MVLKIIKHCHDHSLGTDDLVQGVLLGLVEDTKLEVTHCFPFPRQNDDEEFDAGNEFILNPLLLTLYHIFWVKLCIEGSRRKVDISFFSENDFLPGLDRYNDFA